uniref:Acetyl-CoA carboxylase n=1 Tax=Globodera rostochiensis TaxID=31243 RepID=A0A914I886_GLORO
MERLPFHVQNMSNNENKKQRIDNKMKWENNVLRTGWEVGRYKTHFGAIRATPSPRISPCHSVVVSPCSSTKASPTNTPSLPPLLASKNRPKKWERVYVHAHVNPITPHIFRDRTDGGERVIHCKEMIVRAEGTPTTHSFRSINC